MVGNGRGGDAYSHRADHGAAMIAASHLRKSYGSTAVLEDVSFALAAGQCLALLGPNGAGKTTILRILATLLRPTSGTLALAGVDALKEPEAARALIGVVAHGSYIYEDLSALENLRFWTVMAGGDASSERLRAALRQVELDGVADERARTFSAGMKRRLALARVVLSRARLLFLDEPFTGLDQQGRKWLNEFVLDFKASGGAVVIATHSFATGLGAADRVAILAGGRILADQPCADLPWEAIRGLYESLIDADEAMPREAMS
jgi:heme ABC exporter ATP-binding subunit CcmA